MKKIEITNTKDEVAEIIKKEIISGKISSNDNITQNYLAEKFGLSRMPIREAFNVLVQEGFLEKKNNRKINAVKINNSTLQSYTKILTSVEVELIDKIYNDENGNRNKLFIELKNEINNLPCEDKIVRFHYFISEHQYDIYIASIHKNLMKGLFMYGVYNSHYDPDQVINPINCVIDSIINGEYSKESLYHFLLQSNTPIISNILQQDSQS
eukprot:Anaeramoba_ignava/a355314_53.p1 GENE.a355314_53~~a355314_53.p1  ORF type:complete len:211 (+),score=-4.50 a355314_53:791-1423(+)